MVPHTAKLLRYPTEQVKFTAFPQKSAHKSLLFCPDAVHIYKKRLFSFTPGDEDTKSLLLLDSQLQYFLMHNYVRFVLLLSLPFTPLQVDSKVKHLESSALWPWVSALHVNSSFIQSNTYSHHMVIWEWNHIFHSSLQNWARDFYGLLYGCYWFSALFLFL